MKRKQITELHEKTVDQLKKMIGDQTKELVQARLNFVSGKERKGSVTVMADDLARMKTVLTEKEMGGESK